MVEKDPRDNGTKESSEGVPSSATPPNLPELGNVEPSNADQEPTSSQSPSKKEGIHHPRAKELLDKFIDRHPMKRALTPATERTTVRDLIEDPRKLPDNCYIKLREENSILEKLDDAGALILRAYWRMGKTEMIAYMFSRKNLLENVISVNFQERPHTQMKWLSAGEFKKHLALDAVVELISTRRYMQADNPEDIEFTALEAEVRREVIEAGEREIAPLDLLNAEISKGGDPVYVVFDEFITLASNPEHVRILAQFADLEHIKPIYILQRARGIQPSYVTQTAKGNDEKCLDEFPAGVPQHYVECISSEDCAKICNALGRLASHEFTPEAVEVVRDWSGGAPFEAKIFAFAVLLKKITAEDSNSSQAAMSISQEDAETAIEELMANPRAIQKSGLDEARTNYFKILRIGLRPGEPELLDQIAQTDGVPLHAIDVEKASELEKFRLLRIEPDDANQFVCRIEGKFFKHFLLNRSQWIDPWAPDDYGNDYV